MSELCISFYDCCTAESETAFTVSASERGSLYRIDQEMLRDAAHLFLTVSRLACRAVRLLVHNMARKTAPAMFTAGQRLIHWICNFRI